MARDANTGKVLPIVGYREIDLQNPSVTPVISVMDHNMLRSEIAHLNYQQASNIRIGLEERNPDAVEDGVFRRQKSNNVPNTPNQNKFSVHRPLHHTPKVTGATDGPKGTLNLTLGR